MSCHPVIAMVMKSCFSFCYLQIMCGVDLCHQENVPISSKGQLLHGSSRRSTHGVWGVASEKVPNERYYSSETLRNHVFLSVGGFCNEFLNTSKYGIGHRRQRKQVRRYNDHIMYNKVRSYFYFEEDA
jgi:hypothetical protein